MFTALNNLLRRCQNELWRRFKRSTELELGDDHTEADSPALADLGTSSDQIGSEIPEGDEILSGREVAARFIYESGKFSKSQMKPKQAAFFPECFEGVLETSVCRRGMVTSERMWFLAHTVRSHKRAIAIAEVGVDMALEKGLEALSAPSVYPEHAVLRGWAEGEDCKAKWKVVAAHLVFHSTLVLSP